ncbi:SRPBCC family protein [Streptomyces sp. SP17BM10]|uniref:SRPBCC family protein n=1 Tax=Streptomyces sp. SP17BM10 TaxID=3002530 RepID=UPI002E786A94|nr:SRPBCC family protein [Streptomyces sp. SP17BM10]MEE1787062.1 SRPBCC family protein [Streptomyces sp. SP17BM10]
MAKQSAQPEIGGIGDVLEALPTERLLEQTRDFVSALGERAVAAAGDRVADLADRLVDYTENGGGGGGGGLPVGKLLGAGAAGVKSLVSNGLFSSGGGKKGGGGKETKVTNIVEEINVGVPVRVAYNQWTQFQDFPKFTKRLESVDQESDEKLRWKAGIFLSHRTWESTIVEQVPDETIVWRSKGDKGHVDGTVTFHELAPNLTKIILVLEYHPQGLFERTGNIWRAQGRRVRLELKHFRRHVMTRTILDPDSVEGWRGEIRDSEVVRSHEDALEEEQSDQEPETDESEEPEDAEGAEDTEDTEDEEHEQGDEDEDYEEEPDAEDEYDEDYADEDLEEDDEEADEEADDYDDEYEDEPDEEEPEEDEPEDEEDDERPRGRRRAPARSGR